MFAASVLSLAACAAAAPPPAGGAWEHVEPWNLFNDKDGKGEAGTLANAASPAANPMLIYAGGHNNGASSGIIKSVDGGAHWTRNSNGMWDTRIYGVWIHPSDPQGSHVFAGTGTGIYESKDGAGSWRLLSETASFGTVMSFREGTINGKQYIIANTENGIATAPLSGGLWQKNAAPGGIAQNAYISTVTDASGDTEILTCIGGWGGGQLYYGFFDSPSKMQWEGPISATNTTPGAPPCKQCLPTPAGCVTTPHAAANPCGNCNKNSKCEAPKPINCANAAVDPNDRNHFIYSEGGSFNSYWESFDGGNTVAKNPNHNTGVFFVMIDGNGFIYTATQAGAFVTKDKGKTFSAYHAIMHDKFTNSTMDRVPHDYQNIVPDFRGNNVAFPSDQGLHIPNITEPSWIDDKNQSSYTLINAIGDMHNSISLSALISPSRDGKSRNIISNTWDWDVDISTDDGASWIQWLPEEKSAMWCGEGGHGTSMGKSGHQVMFHHNGWAASADGGHNWNRGSGPGNLGTGFTYVRQANSRVEPTGTCYALLSAPAPGAEAATDGKSEEELKRESHVREKQQLSNYARGMASDAERAVANGDGNKVWLMTSEDYGNNYTWTVMPDSFQPGALFNDPTDGTTLYGMATNCLATSKDKGKTWSACMAGTGLAGPFSQLVIKDSKTMFMMRSGQVPLRTQDGGATWKPLTSTAALFKYGATLSASVSWTGKTLVIHGSDHSAIGRQEYGTHVWKSTDDGNTWTDETGDLVTISLGDGVWYENDFYLLSGGEGIMVKRNFE